MRMLARRKPEPPGFPCYLGIDTLSELASRGDRVCAINIMGGELRQVTPTSHAFSGGNVVFGPSPGRGGRKLKTSVGDIPVALTAVMAASGAAPDFAPRGSLALPAGLALATVTAPELYAAQLAGLASQVGAVIAR